MGNRGRILGLTVAVAGLVLVSATSVSARTLAPTAPRPAIGVGAANHAPIAAPKGVRMVHAQPGAFSAKPGIYTIVTSVAVTANAFEQTSPIWRARKSRESRRCRSTEARRSRPAPWPRTSTPRIHFPTVRAGAVYVNNGTSASTEFTIHVVCAKKLKGYVSRVSVLESNPAGASSGYFFVCPSGDVILGGGALSNSGLTSVNLGTDFPNSSNSWEIYENNASTAGHSVTIYQICAKSTSTLAWNVQNTPGLLDAAGTEEGATESCPSGWSVLGGGVQSNIGSTAVNINSTFALPGNWRIYENNASGSNTNLTVYADCGK